MYAKTTRVVVHVDIYIDYFVASITFNIMFTYSAKIYTYLSFRHFVIFIVSPLRFHKILLIPLVQTLFEDDIFSPFLPICPMNSYVIQITVYVLLYSVLICFHYSEIQQCSKSISRENVYSE